MARPAPPRRRTLIGALVLLAGVTGGGIVWASVGKEGATVTAQRTATDLAAVCATDPGATDRAGADCRLAVEVAKNGPPTAVQVIAGDDGVDGRGVVSTRLEGDRLVVVYSDGETRDVGPVVGDPGQAGAPGSPGSPGQNGTDGANGADGRGIVGTSIVAGRLVVTYTDGATADLGAVVGPAGRGIASLDGTSGRLLVTLTDGEVVDAGPLPRGPAGTNAAAPTRQTFVFPEDGSQRVCERTGGDDTAPVMTCGPRTGGTPTTEGG